LHKGKKIKKFFSPKKRIIFVQNPRSIQIKTFCFIKRQDKRRIFSLKKRDCFGVCSKINKTNWFEIAFIYKNVKTLFFGRI